MPAGDPPCGGPLFRQIVDDLRTTCPPPRGIRVKFRRVPQSQLNGDHGDTTQQGRTITVCVADHLTKTETEDTVLHEYAHVLSWRPLHAIMSDHDAMWGVAFAEVYRAYHGTR